MMTTGIIVGEMKREIQYILQELPEVQGAYGFGSFFRDQPFNDIDLLFVLDCHEEAILSASKGIRLRLRSASIRLCITFHPLILTAREFSEDPLRDMHELRSLI